jgi:hypothetical protein
MSKRWNRAAFGLLAILLVSGALLRMALYAYYEPVAYPDTSTYFQAADDLVNGNLRLSEGRRTPGYPLIVALSGSSPERIFIFQLLEGLICSVLLFVIALRITHRPDVAFAIGLLYSLNLQQLFLEATLLSETTATLALLGVVLALILTYRGRPIAPMRLTVVGLLAGVAILVRPQFVFLLVVCPAFVAVAYRRMGAPLSSIFKGVAYVGIPAYGTVFSWCVFVFLNTGYFTITTQSGLSLVNHSVGFVELASDRFATIREILLKYRPITLAEKGHFGGTGWAAVPEIRAATGMSLPEISAEFQRMSIQLFIEHPLLYARSVARSWIDFWAAPLIWEPNKFSLSGLRGFLQTLWSIEQFLLRMANLTFVILCAATVLVPGLRRTLGHNGSLVSIALIILASSVVQALAEFGASARYATTIESLVLLVVLAITATARGLSSSSPVCSPGRASPSTSSSAKARVA